MEYVLRGLGILAITTGVVIGVLAFIQLGRAGVPFRSIIVAPGVSSSLGIVITGILFLGFGTVISLLRRIRDNTER